MHETEISQSNDTFPPNFEHLSYHFAILYSCIFIIVTGEINLLLSAGGGWSVDVC